nr:cystathionine gamma-lyase-like [Pocillopora verrucosa]
MMIVQRSRLLLFRVLRHFVPRSTLSSPSKMANEAEQKNLKPFPHFGTLAIHAGQEPEQWNSRAVVPPISMATTFKQDDPGVHRGFEYSRSGNPTRNCFEACVAALEGAKHGLASSSGLSATMLLTHLLKSGEHIVCVDDVYGDNCFQESQLKVVLLTARHNKSVLFTLAKSLGGFESLTELPLAIMTHTSVPADQREVLGISETLVNMISLMVGMDSNSYFV